MLVANPQSPEARRPDRLAGVATRARDRVLDRIAQADRIPADEIVLAKAETVHGGRRPMPMFAPHAADQAIGTSHGRKVVALTIDANIQKPLEELARVRARALGPDI